MLLHPFPKGILIHRLAGQLAQLRLVVQLRPQVPSKPSPHAPLTPLLPRCCTAVVLGCQLSRQLHLLRNGMRFRKHTQLPWRR